jgi:hypothetical protein
MGRYLKLAMTVMSRQEPIEPAVVPVDSQKAHPYVQHSEDPGLAACGSSACAGCYDVGDGEKIHPPKCGHGYSDWLKRWEPKGRTQ